ncbi:filamentous hemagglutinin N-terminal domain-containing protein [Desulfonema magnum]|uniref:Filamentous hemagglutinin family N-terminal domain-containing protein n=1 Tax=Desulfonema magnum TaxID=45655 RepID=A0A975GSU2_9BACT|nr:filamentous hemagglutinin N-terminal domain-containing protein [Desulfonema magnum]QTA91438.1 Filamentous hemagglutinin family N-terminal domain-containing protein [Desulfonema magnum]
MRKIVQFVITVFLIITAFFPAYAEGTHPRGIRLDGSLGTAGKLSLPGPDYEIKAEYGQQAGANLFHSFQQFNIHSDESATFTGPDSVKNIISRVTGGETSWIDGRLASAIPDADLYFLNPAGLMFGPNASLDLGGSFHVSTADYLRLGDNEKFYASPLETDVLSTAPPTAFGFLDDDAASIIFEGRGEIAQADWDGKPAGLSVSEGETISVIGGDIEIRKGTHFRTTLAVPNPADIFGDPVEVPRVGTAGSLTAAGGRINMVSVASAGEVISSASGPDVSSVEDFGNITVSDNSLLDVSGQGAGSIFVRGGRFVTDSSELRARTLGDTDGGTISIEGDNLSFTNGAYADGNTYGSGKGSDITLKASETVAFEGENSLRDVSKILLETHSKDEDAGNAGNLLIEAKDVSFRHGAPVSSLTVGKGNGGDVTIRARDTVSFSGQNSDLYHSLLSLGFFGQYKEHHSGGIFSLISSESNGGCGGDILLEAGDISLANGCSVYSTTLGPGSSGDIVVNAAETVSIKGSGGKDFWVGGINSTAFTPRPGAVVGDAGNISLEAGKLTIEKGGYITSSTAIHAKGMESGKAGDVTIRVRGEVCLSGVNPCGMTSSYVVGNPPSGSYISAVSRGTGGTAGEAGNVFLEAESLIIEDGSMISASTSGSSNGGNVEIRVRDSVRVSGIAPVMIYPEGEQPTEVYAVSAIDASSKGVLPDAGSGGKISLSAKEVILTDKGKISTSSSGRGNAGDINLDVGGLRLEHDALISSASVSENHGGSAGTITVEADDSVELFNNSVMITDAVSAGGGKISVNTESSLYLLNSEMSTSVREGIGKGGDISVVNSQSVILNHSNIRANAEAGDGGAIFINTENFIKSSDSRVTATSARGNEGTVNIECPYTDVSSGLTVMPGNYLDAGKWAKTPCSKRSAEDMSRFVIRHKDAAPGSPNDWQPLLPRPEGFPDGKKMDREQ